MAGAAEPDYSFRGSYFDIGRCHGEALRERIIGEMDAAWGMLSQGHSLGRERYIEQFHRRYQPWLRLHLPQVEDEVEGLAQGAGLNEADAFFAAFHGGSAPLSSAEECTAFYCGRNATKNGRIYLGQTKDTPTPPNRYVTMRVDYQDGPHAILLNYPGWLANIGLTSWGIAFTGNARYVVPSAIKGYPLSLLKKAILEARSIEQIQRLIEAYSWQDGALLIADAHGGVLCAEFAGGQTYFISPGSGSFAHSNTILAPAAKADDCADTRSPSAKSRLTAARAILQRGEPFHDLESLQNLTRDHAAHPFSVCLHPSELYSGSTTAAMIAEIDSGRIQLAVGQPCMNLFKEYTVEPYVRRPSV